MWQYLKQLLYRITHSKSAELETPASKGALRPQLSGPESKIAAPDHELLDRYLQYRQSGNWMAMTQTSLTDIADNPDRIQVAILIAAAHEHNGDFSEARQFLNVARQWGASRRLIAGLLVSGVHNTLGRARLASGFDSIASRHFALSRSVGEITDAGQLLGDVLIGNELTSHDRPKNSAWLSKTQSSEVTNADSSEELSLEIDVAPRLESSEKYAGFRVDEYWETRYRNGGNSGHGSYGRLADFKANIINSFIDDHNIERIIEFGCGDGNQLSMLRVKKYVGVDISSTVILMCRNKFGDDPSKDFVTTSEFTASPTKAELTLSLDVIFHLVEDDVFANYMRMLFDASERFCIIYASDSDDKVDPATHVRHRKFSSWVEKNKPNWKLVETIDNDFPHDGSINPKDLSFSNFYVYERI